jgi:hypothetical protein
MAVRVLSHLVIIFLCIAALAEAQERSRGFSIVLVLGESQGSATATKLNAPIERALADVKELLPYKRFQVLDTLWMAGGKNSIGRIRGSGGQEYDLVLDVIQNGNLFDVRLRLDEPGADPGISQIDRLQIATDLEEQKSAIERQLAQARENGGPERRQALEQRLASIRKQIAIARAMRLIDSRFEMTRGETVVVGTSRLREGEKALIVLLTAL